MKILVFADHQNETVKKSALELASAVANSSEKIVVALGPGSEKALLGLSGYAFSASYFCEDDTLRNYNPDTYVSVCSELIQKEAPDLVLASSTALARDLFPRVAARLSAGCASDCTELEIKGTEILVRKPLYSGKCTATVNFHNCQTRIVLMRPNQLPIAAAESTAPLKPQALTVPKASGRSEVLSVTKGESQKLDLTEASVIVSGGRGMKGPEHFGLLENLAEKIGATVGASRAVVDAGWVSHSLQVGQTGKTVAPNLYIAVGISGAIQHLAGMSGSKVIVAINKDPDAPIFQKATYGLVGDAFDILPALTGELEALVQA